MNIFDLCAGLILFIIIILGICGNIISFLVWTKGRRCKKLPGGIYLRSLAVSDTLALCLSAINEAITLVSGFSPQENYDFLCRIDMIGKHFGLMVSTWIVVCFTLERTFAIFRPVAHSHLISNKGTITLMVAVFSIMFILNFPFGIVYSETDIAVLQTPATKDDHTGISGNESGSPTTKASETGSMIVGYRKACSADLSSFFNYLNGYHLWFIDAILIFLLPFSLMTGSNLIVLYLLTSRKTTARSTLDSKIRAVTLRAVIISVAHCLTAGGFTMSVLIPGFLSTAFGVKHSQEYYIMKVTEVLAYMNHSINFLLYSCFGTDFRHDFVELFRKRPQRVFPGSSDQGIIASVDKTGTTQA